MRKAVRNSCFTAVLLLIQVSFMFSQQPRFLVSFLLSDGNQVDTMYLGIKSTAQFCIVTDSINARYEEFLPPPPPTGVFDSRFVWPRTGTNPACFDQGSKVDIRPFTALTQRDTFRIKMQLGDSATKTIRWNARKVASLFTGFTMRYFDEVQQANVNVNMRDTTLTTWNFTDAADPATLNFYSAGLTGTGVEPAAPGVPQEFALSQNYPNPFNPTTSIPFSIAQSAMTDIVVYDILGRQVAVLASEHLNPGYYKAQWDGTNGSGVNAASGVYFVRMTSRSDNGATFSALRKLLLMK